MPRDMIDTTDDKSLSQGTIFNCAFCLEYQNSEVLGLIITARCDIANDHKVRTYNFIPVIPFNIWKESDLTLLLKEKAIKNIIGNIKQSLEKCGFSLNNLKTYGQDKILENISSNNKMKTSDFNKLLHLFEKLNLINTQGNYKEKYISFKSNIEDIIKSIIENKVSDYFFIDNIEGYGAAIVNLREIYEIDIDTAKRMRDGIILNEKSHLLGLNNKIENDFCSIVGQLKSPYIELLLQRFANNFIRIGVANHNTSLINKLCEVN